MVVEPYAVRIASPTAMPIIRATVTTDDAAPKARRPTASTAAVERGVTVSPNPSPNAASVERDRLDRGRPGDQRDIADERRRRSAPARQRHQRGASRTRTAKPEPSAPTAVAPASAPSASRCSSGPP